METPASVPISMIDLGNNGFEPDAIELLRTLSVQLASKRHSRRISISCQRNEQWPSLSNDCHAFVHFCSSFFSRGCCGYISLCLSLFVVADGNVVGRTSTIELSCATSTIRWFEFIFLSVLVETNLLD